LSTFAKAIGNVKVAPVFWNVSPYTCSIVTSTLDNDWLKTDAHRAKHRRAMVVAKAQRVNKLRSSFISRRRRHYVWRCRRAAERPSLKSHEASPEPKSAAWWHLGRA